VYRDLNQFQSEEYDLIIVGGGIYGATICWEAVTRGLKVALFEKSDFGSATSANSLKIIHGGFRYLQNFDKNRVMESIREQKSLMYMAPHLVHPLPVLVPIYGHGLKGKEAFSAGLWLFNYLRASEVQLSDPEKNIPPGRFISENECIELFPSVNRKGLKGGALFFDAQVYNSERLIISFLHSAWQKGARIANYSRVIGIHKTDQRLTEVNIRDVLTGDVFQFTSKRVVLASGPWNERLLGLIEGPKLEKPVHYAKAVNLVTKKVLDKYAVGFLGKNQHNNGKPLYQAKNSYLFVTPWRDYSIIGTAYSISDNNADSFQVNQKDIAFLINEFNQIYSGTRLSKNEILFVHGGLLPVSRNAGRNQYINLTNKFEIVDLGKQGFDGLVTVQGAKYTNARNVAQQTIDYIMEKWGYEYVPSNSANTRLYGGDITRFGDYILEAVKQNKHGLSETQFRSLVFNFGSVYNEVLNYFDETAKRDEGYNQDAAILEAQIRYSVEHEMAQRLGDVVFRRTELGSAGHPGDAALEFSAQVMGSELKWSQSEIDEELEAVQKEFFPIPL
jgi:glycerol-3-phosphate dehydrogenase